MRVIPPSLLPPLPFNNRIRGRRPGEEDAVVVVVVIAVILSCVPPYSSSAFRPLISSQVNKYIYLLNANVT